PLAALQQSKQASLLVPVQLLIGGRVGVGMGLGLGLGLGFVAGADAVRSAPDDSLPSLSLLVVLSPSLGLSESRLLAEIGRAAHATAANETRTASPNPRDVLKRCIEFPACWRVDELDTDDFAVAVVRLHVRVILVARSARLVV